MTASRFLPLLLTALVFSTPAFAVEPVPGGACGTSPLITNSWMVAGGPENGGVVNGMFCNGSTWQGVINFQSSGNVGIGTSNPQALLHTQTAAGVNNQLLVDVTANNVPSISLRSNASNATEWNLTKWNSSYPNGADGFTIDYAGGTPVFTLTTAGYVGVDTGNAPQATLDVSGFARLAENSSAPATCAAANKGSIALTHLSRICVCNGASWVFDYNAAACSW